MTDLKEKKCSACSGETPPLTPQQAEELLQQLEGWQLDTAVGVIKKTFKFKNYFRTISFVNAVAWIANAENHHPDLTVSYNRCTISFCTHSISGLSENDFICAAKVDALGV